MPPRAGTASFDFSSSLARLRRRAAICPALSLGMASYIEYIETDCNRQRRHRTQGHISLVAFEAPDGCLKLCPRLLGRIIFLVRVQPISDSEPHLSQELIRQLDDCVAVFS